LEGVEVPSTSSSSAIESPDEPPAIQIDDTNRRNSTVAVKEMKATEEPLPHNVNPAKRFVFSSVFERKAKAAGRSLCGCCTRQGATRLGGTELAAGLQSDERVFKGGRLWNLAQPKIKIQTHKVIRQTSNKNKKQTHYF